VEINLETVSDAVVVDFGRKAAGALEGIAVEPAGIGDLGEFARGRTAGRLRALMTEVVMPEECQSMPMTLPKAWNQKGSLRRVRNSLWP
jgi:hypothetical protein